MNLQHLRAAGAIVPILALLGCSEVVGPTIDDLRHHRAEWAAARVAHYTYQLDGDAWIYFANRPIRVEVRDGVVQSAVYISTGKAVTEQVNQFQTIDGIFDQAEAALRAGFLHHAAFDASCGYPTQVDIRAPGDGASSLRVSQLRSLP